VDDIGAHIGEEHGAEWHRPDRAELQDADDGKRTD
jgi:hypothetical protein